MYKDGRRTLEVLKMLVFISIKSSSWASFEVIFLFLLFDDYFQMLFLLFGQTPDRAV